MIVIRVAVKVKPENKADFVQQIKQEMIEVKQKFDGCERYALYTDITNEDQMLLYEEWQSQANFDTYTSSDYFKKNGEKLFPMMAEPPEAAYFDAALIPQQ